MKPVDMVFQAGERLHLGAEAEVWAGTWLGRPAVRKQRRTRAWRHPDLDHRLGHRRMMSEARLMVRMHRAGIAVPALYDLDPSAGIMVMQHMPGRPLIDVLRDDGLPASFKQTALASTGKRFSVSRAWLSHRSEGFTRRMIEEIRPYASFRASCIKSVRAVRMIFLLFWPAMLSTCLEAHWSIERW